jgi:hypothetical protein
MCAIFARCDCAIIARKVCVNSTHSRFGGWLELQRVINGTAQAMRGNHAKGVKIALNCAEMTRICAIKKPRPVSGTGSALIRVNSVVRSISSWRRTFWLGSVLLSNRW